MIKQLKKIYNRLSERISTYLRNLLKFHLTWYILRTIKFTYFPNHKLFESFVKFKIDRIANSNTELTALHVLLECPHYNHHKEQLGLRKFFHDLLRDTVSFLLPQVLRLPYAIITHLNEYLQPLQLQKTGNLKKEKNLKSFIMDDNKMKHADN